MHLKYAAALLLASPLSVFADTSACSSITDNAARLACYDRAQPAAAARATAEASNWRTSKQVDVMTDVETYYANLTAAPYNFGDGLLLPSSMTLHIRCTGRETELYIANKDKFMFGPSPLMHRVDKDAAVTAQWVPNNLGNAAFLDSNVMQLVRKLAHSYTLAIRIGQGDGALTEMFDTRGAAIALAPMLNGCKS